MLQMGRFVQTARSRQRWFWWLARQIVGLRYRVSVKGADSLGATSSSTIILPNHPAYIDPALVQTFLRLERVPRPLVFSGTFRRWFLRPFMSYTRAIEVPDLQTASKSAYRDTVAMIRQVVKGVHGGDTFLIYPSGRLQRGDVEVVGGARIASEIIKRCPNVRIVLVRVEGLWGSMFSCAKTGELPRLGRACLKSFAWLCLGGIFFVPRRKVDVFVEEFDRASLPGFDRETINRFLEEWYNISGPRKPEFVRYNWIVGRSRRNAKVNANQSQESPLSNHP